MKTHTYRVVTRGADGSYIIHDYDAAEQMQLHHMKIGQDDCSIDLDIRGLPTFKGLIGPMPEEDKDGKIIRYESPEVFEIMTKKWSEQPSKRRKPRSV